MNVIGGFAYFEILIDNGMSIGIISSDLDIATE